MARVIIDVAPSVSQIVDESDVPQFVTELNQTIRKINDILRLHSTGINTIEFGDGTTAENVFCEFVNVEFGVAGVELSASHLLGKTPVSIVGKKVDKPGEVYFSKAATTTSAYFKCDTDNLSGTVIIT